ncbi:MAG TPA: hypothetical protein VL261_07020 [Nitrospira sp.]|jgi:prophage DNA circulation protein|nr:hypothetical protein [Nitrospira sp.]
MQDSVYIEAWLFWLRPYRHLAAPWNLVLNRWMESVRPRAEVPRPDAVRAWVEDWSNLTGVVPRALYVEALERNEALRAKLEEAEQTIRQLRGANTEGPEIVNTWETAIHLWQRAIHTTGKAQNEWMRMWTDFADNNHRRG